MITSLKEAYSLKNLQLAWKRLNTSTDAFFKSYFRDIYSSYSLEIDKNLRNLAKRLSQGIYQPTQPLKLYIPKKSGLQRTYTLLCVEDQIVYQALINIVAKKHYPKAKRFYLKKVFSNLYAGDRSIFFIVNGRKHIENLVLRFAKLMRKDSIIPLHLI